MTTRRRYQYLVFATLTATAPIGEWRDASPPRYRVDIDGGAGELVVTLPRRYGEMDEPSEDATTATLTHGYRVDVYIWDEDTAYDPDAGDQGRLIFRGTIEEVTAEIGPGRQTVTVRVLSLARILEQSYVTVDYTSQTGTYIAHVLTTNYAPGLTWDANNAADGTGNTLTVSFKRTRLADAYRRVRDMAGGDYVFYVTPTGTVRWLTQTASYGVRGVTSPASATTRHWLSVGRDVTEARLRKSSLGRAKKVTVAYQDGEASSTAGDYDANDPREVLVSVEELGAAGASSFASSRLTHLNRIHLRAELTIPAERYDIESISVGDVISLNVPRVLGTAAGYTGYNDYNDSDLYVVSLDYNWTDVRIECCNLIPSGEGAITNLRRDLDALRARTVDTQLARLTSGAVEALDQFVATGGLTTLEKAGTPVDGDISSVQNGTLVTDSSATRLWARIGGTWRYVAMT